MHTPLLLLLPTLASGLIVTPFAPTVKPLAHMAQVPRHAVPVARINKKAFVHGAATLAATLVLLGNPNAAMAKGGGYGGSHASHSSSSHSSSSHSSSSHSSSSHSSSSYHSSPSRSSSSSRSYSSSPSSGRGSAYSSRSTSAVPRSYKPTTRSPSRSRGGRSRSRSTSPFPEEEEVHVSSSPRQPWRYPYYSNSGSSSVYYDDTYTAPPTVVVRSETDKAYMNGLWSGRLEAAAVVSLVAAASQVIDREGRDDNGEFSSDYTNELTETRELIQELYTEHKETDPLVAQIQMPLSGKYVGESAEDDDGDQPVSTHLTFDKDGGIEGWGFDDVDGPYVIKEGRWSTREGKLGGGRVAWIEKYDDGFEVALRGQIRDDGVIRAMWASDRGISGSVELVLNELADGEEPRSMKRNMGGPQ